MRWRAREWTVREEDSPISKKKELRLNDEIRVPSVRLIGEEGEQYGVVGISDALGKAQAAELDLVEIAPQAEPPVCRIMDYGKYKYQLAKKEADQRKKTHGQEMKQLRVKTFRIDPHDLGIKLKKARQFLEEGHRLLITLMFRAREHSHSDMGRDLLVDQIAKPLEDISRIDQMPAKQGRRMTMMLSPLPNVKKIVAARKAKEAAEAKKLEAQRKAAGLPPVEPEEELVPAGLDDEDEDFDDEEFDADDEE